MHSKVCVVSLEKYLPGKYNYVVRKYLIMKCVYMEQIEKRLLCINIYSCITYINSYTNRISIYYDYICD